MPVVSAMPGDGTRVLCESKVHVCLRRTRRGQYVSIRQRTANSRRACSRTLLAKVMNVCLLNIDGSSFVIDVSAFLDYCTWSTTVGRALRINDRRPLMLNVNTVFLTEILRQNNSCIMESKLVSCTERHSLCRSHVKVGQQPSTCASLILCDIK